MTVHTAAVAGLLALWPAAAQSLIEPSSPEAQKLAIGFDSEWKNAAGRELGCEMRRFAPALDYSLRIWTGFNVMVPAEQIVVDGRESRMVEVFRVTPQSPAGAPVYFFQALGIPKPPERANLKKTTLNVAGGLLAGAGKYKVEWMLVHSSGAKCRKSWAFSVPAKSTALKAGEVAPVETALWSGVPPGAARRRVSILIHASPVWPRRYVSRLSAWDRQILLSTLSALLRQGGFSSASVTIFDLERRRTILREEHFEPRSLRRLMRQLSQVDYSTISMETLTQSRSPRPFLEEMLQAELKQPEAPDAVVFIGSRWRGGPKLDGLSPALKESMPKAWFLAFTTPQTISEPDSLSSLVKAVRGRVVSIFGPGDLAGALREVSSAP
ncbi:MAG: hypothetical protein HY821_02525 [Acidobacteria bacterium]|nr:hypothetical protein [Acidobacteriota bacterium]